MNVFKEELTQVDFPNFFSVFRFSATLQNWCGGCRQGCWGRYPFEFNVQNMGCKTCSCHNLVQWVKAFFGTASRSSGSTGEALFQSHFAFNFISYSTWSVTVTVLRSQKKHQLTVKAHMKLCLKMVAFFLYLFYETWNFGIRLSTYTLPIYWKLHFFCTFELVKVNFF